MRIILHGPAYQALRRGLRAFGVIALALGSVGAAGARADVTGPEIVGWVNAQRAAQGIPAAILHDAALSDGCAKHNAYGRLNNVLLHDEDPALPGYTAQGDAAAGTSVLYRGTTWTATRNPFETAPLHLHALLAPRLDRMGASEDQGFGCATTTASRARPAPSTDRTYTYPGNGATGWVLSQVASESPYTPGEKATPPIPANTRTGPYLYVMFDGPTVTLQDIAQGSSATLTGPQGPLTVSVVDNGTPGLRGYLPTGMQVIPIAPLLPATTYTASVAASVTTQGGIGPPRSFSHTWSFTTEALPDTSITSGPSGAVASSSASFAFSSTKPGSSFECKLDAGGWVFCSSPKSLTALADGSHTWSVRARDQAGNIDPSPATRTWTVDTTPPQTSITSGPTGTVASGAATFAYSSTESGSFQCRLDAGAWVACASPRALSGLPDGAHTWSVRAIDVAGNVDLSPATRTWTVDTTPPDTSIGTGPSGTVASSAASFSFSATETAASFECRLDTGAWVACASPRALSGLSDGSHTWSVRARDVAGNLDPSPATRTWTVDATSPDTSIASGPAGTVASGAASFSFSATEAGLLECKLDAGQWAACASPRALSGLADGSHTFSVRGADAAGNVDPSPATRSWTVDTTAPQTTIDSGPTGSVQQTGATFTMSASEAGSSFACRLDAGAWAACASPRSLSGLADGTHTFDVRATDPIGNTATTPATRTWTVDTIAPSSPTPNDVDPDSPANDPAPKVKGTAAAGSTVRLYTDTFCSSAVAATGSATDFAAPGLAVSVANGSSTTYWATATDAAGNRSACSSSSVTYVEIAVATTTPPPPAPPPPPPVDDDTAPTARLSGSTSQRLGKTVRVGVRCSDEACRATATGSVQVPRIGAAKSRRFTLTKAVRGIGKGPTATLAPKLSYPARVAIRRALRRHRRITVRLRVKVADAANNARTLTRQVKLRL